MLFFTEWSSLGNTFQVGSKYRAFDLTLKASRSILHPCSKAYIEGIPPIVYNIIHCVYMVHNLKPQHQ